MIFSRPFVFFRPSIMATRLIPTVNIVFIFTILICSCSQHAAKEKSTLVWNKDLPLIGSLSSPRTADLNNDGVLDIVIGAGKNEYQKTDMGILAFDGRSGNLLWKQEAIDQVFGSATFCDVTGDKVKDVIIG